MAAITTNPFLLHFSSNPQLPKDYQSKLPEPMLALLLVLTLSLISLSVLIFSLYRRLREKERRSANSIIQCFLSRIVDKTHESKLTHLTHSLLLEILPSNSPKWATLFSGDVPEGTVSEGSALDRERVDSSGEECGKKKKKKRAKKKRPNSPNSKAEDGAGERLIEREELAAKEKQELICLYPFTSLSSATQRKIKQQYDQLVKSHEANGLTLAQVGQFVNCLIEAKTELQHRSDAIQRKFTITKALLFKAERSSFDRLRQQLYKIELEQKRLEEDAFVYNWLQQQLKLSPAYKKMLEIDACMELEASAKSSELGESTDAECGDISFEELLAQEKRDSFWQKHRKSRS